MNKYQDGVDVSVVVGHEPVSRDSSDWGYPGFLTPDEVRVYVSRIAMTCLLCSDVIFSNSFNTFN